MANPDNGAQPMLPYTIRGQFIKDLSFENPDPLKTFSNESDTQPSINVDIQAKGQNIGGADFEVSLIIKTHAKREEINIFVVELVYSAFVTLNESVDKNEIGKYLMVDVPRIIFPAARNIVADVTRDGGFPPLMLNTVDFAALYAQQAKEQQQAAS